MSTHQPETRATTRGGILAGLAVLLTTALLIPVNTRGRLLGCVFDFAHVPVFAIAVFAAVRLTKSTPRGAIGLYVGIIFFGAAIEVVQQSVGRTMQLGDVLANVAGATVGLCAAVWPRLRAARWPLLLFACLLTVAALFRTVQTLRDVLDQRRDFPLLCSFENDRELSRWEATDGRLRLSEKHASSGTQSLMWEFEANGLSDSVSCQFFHPIENWSDYALFEFDVWNDSEQPIELRVRVEDVLHNGEYFDCFNFQKLLASGKTTITIPMRDIRDAAKSRKIDLRSISRVMLYVMYPDQPQTFFFDRFELKN